ncbi:hypothetical protein BU16DRAFT_451380 [Lophium mytilinum]|uniref:Zn(2)-C6 fungal-type domain-containing protein n=1 Tax=Lophium mytilinum TaxID=390894 RepID=A0A6A6RB04_9PEZI|nr:hypothetical protein BU16DRAFT_451380 [Lophium mytilinum]
MDRHSSSDPSAAGVNGGPPSSPRFYCPECSRGYKAVETLNRHRKNHSNSNDHVCRICQAGFKRKDLLDRHMQIHERSSSREASKPRRRDNRACVRCSQLKIKCDRLVPCTRCARGDYRCQYRDRDRAISDASTTLFPGGPISPPKSSFGMPSEAGQSIGPFVAGGVGPFPNSNVTSPAQMLNADASHQMDWTPELALSSAWTGELWSQNAAWPWLHEAMYLSQDPGWDDQSQLLTPATTATLQTRMPWESTIASDTPATTWHSSMGSTPQNVHPSSLTPQHTIPPPLHSLPPVEQTKTWLIHKCFELTDSADGICDRARFWRVAAIKVEQAFDLQGILPADGPSSHIFEYFIKLFLENFHPLWPMFWRHDLAYNDIHPHLYITLSAIGAVYASKAAANFHLQMLDGLRMAFVMASFKQSLPDESLCQSLVQIQSATLYFGHRRAFSTAQQLGSIVVSLARKMNLFGESEDIIPALTERKNSGKPIDDLVRRWIKCESRKRLAFGILRLEVFISILLGTRPLVSFEEIKMRLPCPNALFDQCGGEQQLAQELLHLVDEQPSYVYCDLVNIALEQEEELPVLSPHHLELLLFGLNIQVWRFSHDPGLMSRLGATPNSSDRSTSERSYDTSNERSSAKTGRIDLLDHSRRHMSDLRNDYNRILSALRKWKRAMVANSTRLHIAHHRDTLLASHLLYNLSFIQLRSDLPTIHRLFLDVVKGEPQYSSLEAVYRWSTTTDAWDATEHACATWSLIMTEAERPLDSRASFNILSNVALLHAAVVVWAYAGTHTTPTSAKLDMEDSAATRGKDLRLYRANNEELMGRFASLLRKISLVWTTVTSVQTTVYAMAQNPIPLQP